MIPTAPAPRRSPVPLLFVALACSLPALIAMQLFLVGLGVFADAAAWALHRALGGALVVPAAGALILAALRRDLHDLRGSTALVLILYVMQFVWLIAGREIGSGPVQALHAANAMLLTAASLRLASLSIRSFRTVDPMPEAGPAIRS